MYMHLNSAMVARYSNSSLNSITLFQICYGVLYTWLSLCTPILEILGWGFAICYFQSMAIFRTMVLKVYKIIENVT